MAQESIKDPGRSGSQKSFFPTGASGQLPSRWPASVLSPNVRTGAKPHFLSHCEPSPFSLDFLDFLHISKIFFPGGALSLTSLGGLRTQSLLALDC